MYKLKPGIPDFEVMDGPDRGKTYRSDRVYAEVPEGLKDKFDAVTPRRGDADTGGKKK